MVIRQTLPFSLSADGRGAPSHLSIAIGVSIGFHVVIGLYVAFMQFTGPPQAVYGPDRIIEMPWIVERKPPPPPKPTKSQPQRPPTLHDSVPINPPITPLDAPVAQQDAPSQVGPIATLNPPQTLVEGPAARDPIIRDPRWVRRPEAGDFARFYPERALRLGRQGSAEITCAVMANGQVRDCRITGETPVNLGFGQAALKLSRFLQIAPKTIDGEPVDGGTLVVPIEFRLS